MPTVALGIATETDVALGLDAIQKVFGAGPRIDEGGTALLRILDASTRVNRVDNDVTSIEKSEQATVVALGVATETDTALSITVASGIIVNLGLPSETDTALPMTVSGGAGAGGALLMETGDVILMETGDAILLE